MKQADKICIVLIMAACVLFYVLLWVVYDGVQAEEVVVKVKDEEVLRVSLWENATYSVTGKMGEVMVEINNGKVRVEKENSPYHYCSIQGYVSNPSTPIICLPNEVVVRIEGSEKGAVDTQIQ